MRILSDFNENLKSGFYIWNPDFDEIERERLQEEEDLARMLAKHDLHWDVPQQEFSQEEINERNKERFLADKFCQENIEKVSINEDCISVRFTNPGYGVRWARFSLNEVQGINPELQERFLKINPRVFPYLDSSIVQVKEVRFFIKFFKKGKKGKIYVNFVLSSGQGVVYALEDNKEILAYIKQKFNLFEEVEEAWREFKDSLSKASELKRAIQKAQKIYKKESGLSDWLQYTVKYNDKMLYIFKPRLSRSGRVYYSVFKIIKGDKIQQIPDKVESLFSCSTDRFLKEWEPLLERR